MTTTTAPARIAMLTLDCADVGPIAQFWAALLGYEVVADSDDYAMLRGPDGPALGFGRVPDHEAPAWPNPRGTKQFHLDLAVGDLEEATERALALGARLAEPQPGETWRVLIDPGGHPFCLTRAEAWG